jgi:hypothetical protein
VRRPAVLVALLGSLALLLTRRGRAKRAERDLWTEASLVDAPDLR